MQTPSWNAELLQERLDVAWPGIDVDIVAETGSTNSDLVEAARAGHLSSHGTYRPRLLVAAHQSAGRGRHGRRWHSRCGGSLTFSLAVPLATTDWSGLSLAVGVAIADALEPEPGTAPRIGLKWPNDLWLAGARSAEGRKLGGVLVETVTRGATRIAIVGVGLNVHAAGWSDARNVAAGLDELEPQTEAPSWLGRIAPALADALRRFERDGFAPFHDRYARRDVLFGVALSAVAIDTLAGVGAGIAPDGRLQLQLPDGRIETVTSGEVSVRPAGMDTAGVANRC